jgi:transcription elongation factor Elf1
MQGKHLKRIYRNMRLKYKEKQRKKTKDNIFDNIFFCILCNNNTLLILNITLLINPNLNYIVCFSLFLSSGISGARESEESSASGEIILTEC